MKQKNKKDMRLESLFSEYAQDEKMPSASVTQAAKEYMNKQRATEEVTVPVEATAGGGSSPRKTFGNKKPFYIAAFVLVVLIIALACYFATQKSSGTDLLMGLSSVSSGQLSETSIEYTDKDFLPFVNSSAVTEYKEYALTGVVDNYGEGDMVAYYVSFNTSENISVSVYVEVGGIYLTDLTAYKKIKTEKNINGITFYFKNEQDYSSCYFNYNNYGYNVAIDTKDKSAASGILSYISNSFKR